VVGVVSEMARESRVVLLRSLLVRCSRLESSSTPSRSCGIAVSSTSTVRSPRENLFRSGLDRQPPISGRSSNGEGLFGPFLTVSNAGPPFYKRNPALIPVRENRNTERPDRNAREAGPRLRACEGDPNALLSGGKQPQLTDLVATCASTS